MRWRAVPVSDAVGRSLKENSSLTREKELTAQGWQRRATYDEPRLSEMIAMYKDIGFEVHVEPIHPEEENGCTGCMQLTPDLYKTVYTRGKPSSNSDDDIY